MFCKFPTGKESFIMFVLASIFSLFNHIDTPDLPSLSSTHTPVVHQVSSNEYTIPNHHSDIPSNEELGIPKNAINIVLHQNYASYDTVEKGKTCHNNISYDLRSSSQSCDK